MIEFKINTGHDHYNNKPLYQVSGITNDYIGEWTDCISSAVKELRELINTNK